MSSVKIDNHSYILCVGVLMWEFRKEMLCGLPYRPCGVVRFLTDRKFLQAQGWAEIKR